MTKLTQEILHQIRYYDKVTGYWYHLRLDKQGNLIRAGSEHWSSPQHTHRYVRLDLGEYGTHYAHRLAFLWVTGEMPKHFVDHRDGNGLHNAWSNLREATPAQNAWNRTAPPDHPTGELGISIDQRGNYDVEMCSAGLRFHKLFKTFDEALLAKQEHERVYRIW